MPTATTPTIDLCDDLVAALTTSWAPAAPNSVERDYFPRYGDGDDDTIALGNGRKVVVKPADYGFRWEIRGRDLYTHNVTVFVTERWTQPGMPTREWIDERVNWVHLFIVQGFDFGRAGGPSWNRQLITLSHDVRFVTAEVEQMGHLFQAVVDFEFEESVDV